MTKLQEIIKLKTEFEQQVSKILGSEEITLDEIIVLNVPKEMLLNLYAETVGYLNVTDFYRDVDYPYFTMNNHGLTFSQQKEN